MLNRSSLLCLTRNQLFLCEAPEVIEGVPACVCTKLRIMLPAVYSWSHLLVFFLVRILSIMRNVTITHALSRMPARARYIHTEDLAL